MAGWIGTTGGVGGGVGRLSAQIEALAPGSSGVLLLAAAGGSTGGIGEAGALVISIWIMPSAIIALMVNRDRAHERRVRALTPSLRAALDNESISVVVAILLAIAI
jgi:hypothetical protein